MDGFATKVRYSLALLRGSLLAASTAGKFDSGDGRAVTIGVGLRVVVRQQRHVATH
jgi:hypothetical protein